MKYRIVKSGKEFDILAGEKKIGTAKSVDQAMDKLREHRGLPKKKAK